MNFTHPRLLSAAAGALLMLSAGFSTPVSAQELSESHLSAARKAISATRATATFDNILFNASAGLKNQLTAKSPDKADEISNIVDEEALALAPRRGDLEGEAARLFANTFTEAELNEIASFFGSETGGKYLNATPVLARELGKSARVWANGISRDLAANVQKRLEPAAN
ncbi:MAG: DUF2059 domain-containing protein [Pseudomonadota bacterium]